jgi:hypothetical protein
MQDKISEFEDARKLVAGHLPTILNELKTNGSELNEGFSGVCEGDFGKIIKWAKSVFDPANTWFESCKELHRCGPGYGEEGMFCSAICDYVQPHWNVGPNWDKNTTPSIRVVLSRLWDKVEGIILHEMESGVMDGCSGKHIQYFLSSRLGGADVLRNESSGSLKNNKEIMDHIGLETPSTFSELFIEKTKLKKMNESISLSFSADGFAVISSAADQVRSGQYYPPSDPRYQPPPTPPPVKRALSTSDIDQEFDKTILGIINNLDWKDVKGLF